MASTGPSQWHTNHQLIRGNPLNQFVHWLIAWIDEVLRDAGQVEDASILSIHAGAMVQRSKDLLKRDRAKLRLLASRHPRCL